jgi:hypothetical protein
MRNPRFVPGIIACAAAAALSAGCGKSETPAPTPANEAKAETPVTPANQAMTVDGCLKAGEGADTFVLTAASDSGAQTAATYHLVGVNGVNLRDHIGERVQVSGTVNAEKRATSLTAQEPAATSGSAPAPEPSAAAGATPTVSTSTHVDIKQIDVSSIQKIDGKCEL